MSGTQVTVRVTVAFGPIAEVGAIVIWGAKGKGSAPLDRFGSPVRLATTCAV